MSRAGDFRESRVGVDSNRVRHRLQQGNIVSRIAVEAALFERIKRGAPGCEPGMKPGDLALLEAGDSGRFSGVAPGAEFGFGGKQMINAEFAGDRVAGDRGGAG